MARPHESDTTEERERIKTEDLNVVILPSEDVATQVEEWGRRIADEVETYFTLDRQNAYLPHLSVYNAQYPAKNDARVISTLEEIVATQKNSFDVTLSGFTHYNNTGFVFYNAVLPNEALLDFHESVVDLLNPLREGLIPAIAQTLSLPDPEMRSIRKYGGLVKDVYPPHITLTRLKDPRDFDKVVELINGRPMSFEVQKIALVPFAQHGTCPFVMEEFFFGT